MNEESLVEILSKMGVCGSIVVTVLGMMVYLIIKTDRKD